MSSAFSSNQNQEHHIPIDVNERWVRSIEESMTQVPRLLKNTAGRDSCCIFRVPPSLMKIHPEIFQPQIVSIGPYYHGREHLQMIEEHKRRLLSAVLARTREFKVGLDEFFRAIASKEEEIRDFYSETVECSSQELIKMMILDGCFIIELVRKVELGEIDNEPLLIVPWILYTLARDFLRLENQIPFFVLKILFNLSFPESRSSWRAILTKRILIFFDYSIQRPEEVREKFQNHHSKHLLELMRSTFIPSSQEPTTTRTQFLDLIQPVEKLLKAGIKFRRREGTQSFLDITFRPDGVLELPPLPTGEIMSCFLRNCIVFELCYRQCSTHFTAYVNFMAFLIHTPYDAGYLSDHRIIENYFGTSEQVVNFFNEVCKEIFFDLDNSYLAQLFEDVNKYYRNYWHVQRAGFKQTYFGSTWVFISAIAALILLILTFIQTFYAIYGYHKPSQKN